MIKCGGPLGSQIQKNVRDFCNKELRPNVVSNNLKNSFDKGLYKLFGSLGLLGQTLNSHGGAGTNFVSYGLTAYEIEKIDSSYRSSISDYYENEKHDLTSIPLYRLLKIYNL